MKTKVVSLVSTSLGLSILFASIIWADENYERKEHRSTNHKYEKKGSHYSSRSEKNQDAKRLLPAYAPLYRSECASCHMAYQPEFLPRRSWKKMMRTLENHFDTDASMDSEDAKKITAYLLANASDSRSPLSRNKFYREISRSIPRNSTPLAISQTPKFKKEHREIPRKLIMQKEVKTLANCAACHRKAERDSYREWEIDIPNYGRWDD